MAIYYPCKGDHRRIPDSNRRAKRSWARWCAERLRRLHDSHRKAGKSVSAATIEFYSQDKVA